MKIIQFTQNKPNFGQNYKLNILLNNVLAILILSPIFLQFWTKDKGI